MPARQNLANAHLTYLWRCFLNAVIQRTAVIAMTPPIATVYGWFHIMPAPTHTTAPMPLTIAAAIQ
jgi:hypothetical protein